MKHGHFPIKHGRCQPGGARAAAGERGRERPTPPPVVTGGAGATGPAGPAAAAAGVAAGVAVRLAVESLDELYGLLQYDGPTAGSDPELM
jgi:hypothetical protein